MELSEFKGWLRGYIEGTGKVPPKEKLLEELAAVNEPASGYWRYPWTITYTDAPSVAPSVVPGVYPYGTTCSNTNSTTIDLEFTARED